jgi:hypothetical protein
MWEWRRGTGLERFELLRAGSGWVLRGTILVAPETEAFQASYEVSCDGTWNTQAVEVQLRGASAERSLRLEAADGHWYHGGREQESLGGCLDVDLGWSPSTNTLPIRRLGLEVGSSRAVTAAWIRFPELTLEPLSQEYCRLAERRYRYASAGGGFVAEIEVDDQGLVVDYAGVWRRVPQPGARST